MSDKIKLFIVDDDVSTRMILADEFDSEIFDVHEFENGQNCIDSLELKPDLILLDVEMPGMDGYETCRKIKQRNDSQDMDVIFISSHDTTDEKLSGYDAGGCDYLIKPIQHLELEQKISLAINNKTIRADSAAGQKMAMETAMTAMTSAGEQGVVLEFLRNSFYVESVEGLATMVVDSVSRFELANSVQLRTDNVIVNKGTSDPVPPLEEELLKRLKDSEKIISRGQRVIFNFGNASILIKNMPDDADKAGRLRDHIAILLEGANSTLSALVTNVELKQLINDANHILKDVAMAQKEHEQMGQKIMDDMLSDVEESFLSWGLSEGQEKTLVNIVHHGVEQSLKHAEKGQAIDAEMTVIYKRLEGFSD